MNKQGVKSLTVVGGSSGIGFATARMAVDQGWSVNIASRNKEKLDSAAASLGSQVTTHPFDMTEAEDVAHYVSTFADDSLDGLVISASSVAHGPFESARTEDIRAMFEAKFIAPYVVAREFLPKLKLGGAIVFFSGVLSRRPGQTAAGLAAVNAAVEGLTRALAKELGPALRVNCISPGMTRSDAYAAMPDDQREAMFEGAAKGLPLKRVAEPGDIAEAVLFALTNKFTTGHVFDVDGGHLIA